jgi:hypothetical protein
VAINPVKKRVYLLGAGFSGAISEDAEQSNEKMPLLRDLSDAVIHHLGGRYQRRIPHVDTPLAKDFEQSLSYLVENPPWFSDSEQARNMAVFLEITLAVHWELRRFQWVTVLRQNQQQGCQEWLQRLVQLWEDEKDTVITFNYDQLVELAWLNYANYHKNTTTRLYPVPLTPIGFRTGEFVIDGGTAEGARARPGLKLLKLHGSLGWFYSGIDSPPSDPVYDVPLERADWGPNAVPPWDPTQFDLPTMDLKPMTVPPVNSGDAIVPRLCDVLGIPEVDSRIDTKFVGHGANAIPLWVDTFATPVEN